MTKLRKTSKKKAAKATARHSWRGLSSKAKRKPLRGVTLLGAGGAIGGVVGAAAGWFAGRRKQPST